MTIRRTIWINIQLSFILFVILSANVIYGQEKAAKKNTDSTVVVVYYFHGQFRCITCTNMEKWAQAVIETTFKKEHKQGLIKFQAVNYEIEKNWSYFDKYFLSDKHIILSRVESGKETSWIELEEIWDNVKSKALFKSYIEKEIRDFLTKKNENSNKEKKL